MNDGSLTPAQRQWRHGGPWSTLAIVLAVGGALVAVFWTSGLGIALAAVGVLLGVFVALQPVNRRR